MLAAGDRGSIDRRRSGACLPEDVRSDDTAWTTGRVVFRDASRRASRGRDSPVVRSELQVADSSLLSQHVTTTFDDSEPIDQVLKSLALVLGARVERQGDSATLHSNRGSAIAR